MVLSQVKHLVKMANHLQSNMIWSTTLCIYFPLIHPPIYLINYLFTYYPPTHKYLLFTDQPIYLYLPTYFPTYIPIIYLSTYLPIISHLLPYLHTYLLIHQLTYLILTTRCNRRFNHYVQPLNLTKFQSLDLT